jgi:hypothetical protein
MNLTVQMLDQVHMIKELASALAFTHRILKEGRSFGIWLCRVTRQRLFGVVCDAQRDEFEPPKKDQDESTKSV